MDGQTSATSTVTAPARCPGVKPWPECILACIDDSDEAQAIVDWLLALPASATRVVVLLSFLPEPEEVRSRGIFLDKVRQHLRERGRKHLAAIAPAVARSRIKYRERIELIDGAERLLACAHEEGADAIVIVEKQSGPMQRRLRAFLPSRSLAGSVAEVADIPVVILKQATA